MAGLSRIEMRLRSLPRFARFAMVGAAGFVIDISVLNLAIWLLHTGPYVGRVISYLSSATITWYMNSRLTFHDSQASHRGKQWIMFVACSSLAGILNYSTYAAFVRLIGVNAWSPTIGVGLGACAGLAVNYTLSRRLVFRSQ